MTATIHSQDIQMAIMSSKYPLREKQTLFILQADGQSQRKAATDSTSFASIITEDNVKRMNTKGHKKKRIKTFSFPV